MAMFVPEALMDAAWVSIKNGDSSWTRQVRRAMKDELLLQFPDASEDQLSQACAMAKCLLDSCYEVGDACRNEAIPRAEAEATLQDQCPDFSPETYAQAVSYGMYISR